MVRVHTGIDDRDGDTLTRPSERLDLIGVRERHRFRKAPGAALVELDPHHLPRGGAAAQTLPRTLPGKAGDDLEATPQPKVARPEAKQDLVLDLRGPFLWIRDRGCGQLLGCPGG